MLKINIDCILLHPIYHRRKECLERYLVHEKVIINMIISYIVSKKLVIDSHKINFMNCRGIVISYGF